MARISSLACVDKLVFSWGGNPGVGSLHRFRKVAETPAPTPKELEVLRDLHARTNRAHSEAA